jgi:voltage-gated potassium channel
MTRFLHEPPSIRLAAGTIVAATTAVVLGGGVLMYLLDKSEYPNVWVGMWWALQTVTTVGYGDVTPAHASGRIVASAVMLEGIAFVAIITAAITSTFVARASREFEAAHAKEEETSEQRLDRRLDELGAKLDSLEAAVRATQRG